MEVAEQDADGQNDHGRNAECRAGELELLERLPREEAGIVGDKAKRLDERVRVGDVGDHARVQGTSTRRTATSRRSQTSANATTRNPAA